MKRKLLIAIPTTVMALLLLFGLAWWHSPVTLLRGVNPADVARIEVSSGSTGKSFCIEDADTIARIVSNIQAAKLHREEWEQIDGFSYSLSFYKADGTRIDAFILNGDDEIRKGDMTLECESELLCFELLRELEKSAAQY